MKETSKILIDIFSLLDIRQAILYNLYKDKEQLAEYLVSEEYNFRTQDLFPNIEQALYETQIKESSIDLLPASTITYILTSLKSKLANLEQRNSFYGEKKVPEIVLNIYPFKLNELQIKQLQNLLFVKLETNTLITIINVPLKDISPVFIKNGQFVSCFLYDFSSWIALHASSLEKVKLIDTIMYFPSIAKTQPTEEELKKITKLGFKDIFNYTEFLLSSVVTINFLPTVFYSNMITAVSHLSKFDEVLKNKKLSSEESAEVDMSKVKLPEGM